MESPLLLIWWVVAAAAALARAAIPITVGAGAAAVELVNGKPSTSCYRTNPQSYAPSEQVEQADRAAQILAATVRAAALHRLLLWHRSAVVGPVEALAESVLPTAPFRALERLDLAAVARALVDRWLEYPATAGREDARHMVAVAGAGPGQAH